MTAHSRWLSDQERATLHLHRPGHVCDMGQWFRADPRPGTISNRYQRHCKCGEVQFGRGDQWARVVRIERREIDTDSEIALT